MVKVGRLLDRIYSIQETSTTDLKRVMECTKNRTTSNTKACFLTISLMGRV